MSSKENKVRDFVDVSPNIQKNPEFISFFSREQENKLRGTKLELTDYVAIFIALLETVFFPVIFLILVMVGMALFITYFPYVANFIAITISDLLSVLGPFAPIVVLGAFVLLILVAINHMINNKINNKL